jgi:hypothetical protein
MESFRLAPSERGKPMPSVGWALLAVLVCFFVVKFWIPYAGVPLKQALGGAVLAALIAWWGFIRTERVEGTGVKRVVERVLSRAIVCASVVLTTAFALKFAYGVIDPLETAGSCL